MKVSVDTAPSTDLNQTLIKVREDYETLAAKNHRDLEVWYQSKVHQTYYKFELKKSKTFAYGYGKCGLHNIFY